MKPINTWEFWKPVIWKAIQVAFVAAVTYIAKDVWDIDIPPLDIVSDGVRGMVGR